MRILLVGSNSNYAIERAYLKYLPQQPGVSDVHFFPAQDLFLDYYRRSLINKLKYRAGISRILHKINSQLAAAVDEIRPDSLLIFKGMEIFASTLSKFRSQGIKLINFNPDNPFIFTGRGSGNRNVTLSIEDYDLYLTYDTEIYRRLSATRTATSAILPFGFDLNTDLYTNCTHSEEILLPSFIGNPDRSRLSFLNQLADSGINLDVYGNGWKPNRLHPNIKVKGYITGDDLWRYLRRYRIQLNLMRRHNPHSHNMRSFEIPAVGGIQLAPDTPDHASYFEPGQEIFLFRSVDQCAKQIRSLLSLSQSEALEIRDAARRRSLLSGYSYEFRASLLASLILKISN